MPESGSEIKIGNFIKYCQEYIKLTNPSLNRFQVYTDPIKEEYLSMSIIFSSADCGSYDEPISINLPVFYEYTPQNIPEEFQEEYNVQKKLAQNIDSIQNKFQINEYTKQVTLNFGFFKIETVEENEIEQEDGSMVTEQKNKVEKKALFLLPIEIISGKKISIKILEDRVIPNTSFLYNILGEKRYYEFLDEINQSEEGGKFKLPLAKETILGIWEELKTKLKLAEANFDENSFEMNSFVISLTGKSNYFLDQDYKFLTSMESSEFLGTALESWLSEDSSSIDEPLDDDYQEIYFPFPYNKDQLSVLSILGNKAAVVEGPPGTGKSQTIANLLCHLAANKKKILFVSQKAQAIKVVKDNLKKLDIDYLYGYIPSQYSSLNKEEEEIDGAAYALRGLSGATNYFSNQNDENVNPLLEKKRLLKENANNSIETQREIFKVFEHRENLRSYEIDITDIEKFNKSNKTEIESLIDIEKRLAQIYDKINKYRDSNGKYIQEKDREFKNVSFENNFSEDFLNIINNIPEDAFERDGFLERIKEKMISEKLKKLARPLPKEVFSDFLNIIKERSSRGEKIHDLKDCLNYFKFKERLIRASKIEKERAKLLKKVGLEDSSFERLKNLMEKDEVAYERVKDYVVDTLKINSFKIFNTNDFNKSIKAINTEENNLVKSYLRNIVNNNLTNLKYSARQRALIARISRSLEKSKKAYHTFDKLRNEPANFDVMKEIIPIWMMSLEDASRILPLQEKMFDYVILDEASQCNIAYAIPIMYRAEKIVLFGDSEQMRDDSIRFKSNMMLQTLAKKFGIPEHLQIKALGDTVQSIMDIGYQTGFLSKPLTYHYRSPKEIIGFSNKYFYTPKRKQLKIINNKYLPYKDTNRVLVNHILPPHKELDISGKTNKSEAEYICRLIDELKNNPQTQGKSIGVLSFFSDQATLLREMIEDKNIKVSVIEGIQGDERDIIIYSFVIADPGQKNKYISLTGEGGEINKVLAQGRVNVAFSRAKQQVHCVTSLSIEKWPEGIWIKKYLEYVEKEGVINFFGNELQPFDSKFEEDFYKEILLEYFGGKYQIQNQVKSCGFEIDFVLTDKEGKSLAIECDGPTHFENESEDIHTSNDYERQAVLESSGWNFYRLNYSDWINKDFDRHHFVNDIQCYFKQGNLNLENVVGAKKSTDTNLIEKVEEVDSVIEAITGEEIVEEDAQELLDFMVTDNISIKVKYLENEKYLIMSEFVNRGNFTGYTTRNIIISSDNIANFLDKLEKVIKGMGEERIPWKDSNSAIVLLKSLDSDMVDIRQYIASPKYTGYTKKGFRFSRSVWKTFLDELKEKLGDPFNK